MSLNNWMLNKYIKINTAKHHSSRLYYIASNDLILAEFKITSGKIKTVTFTYKHDITILPGEKGFITCITGKSVAYSVKNEALMITDHTSRTVLQLLCN